MTSSHGGARPQPHGWRLVRRLLIALISVMSVLLLAGTVGFVYTFSKIELPDREPPLLQTTLMCPANVTSDCNSKNSIAQLSGGVNRIPVEWDQIPPVVVNAVLGAEDRSFFSHGGVDPSGIVRALWADARNLGVAQGGSTITQQYVKNVYLTQERTITRKIKEVVMAVKLERELSKEEILTRYLNLVYFGRGAYGIEAAARAYFGVHMADLSVAQAAYLAGLIRSPESADAQLPANDPRRDEQRATAEGRRHSVLQAMLEMRTIDATEFAAADGNDWSDVVPRSMHDSYGDVAHPDWGTEYFVDYVKRWMVDKGGFTDAQIYGGGLRVYTTLDMDAQGAAAYAVRSTLDQPFDPAAALVSIDDTGAVRAMIGGFDFNGTGPYSKVNLAVGADGGGSGRQAGSAFKTFTLAEAMVQGMPLSKTYDAPAKIVIPKADNGKDWNVANYEDAGLGKLDVVAATQKSSNTAYAQIVMDVGPNNVSALAKQMGVTAPLPAVPSITLGSPDVSVMDMASAYSTLADGGDHVAPVVVTKVTDAKGNVLYENRPSRTKVLDPMIVAKVDFVLNQVIEDGTGTGAKFGESVAGKTGTTENYRDAWFAGFTCKLTTAVWVGYPDGTFMRNVHGIRVTGGSFPATIWRKYMSAATAGLESCPYPRPPELDTTTSAPAPPAPPPAPTRPPVEVTTTTATEPPPPPTTVKPKESLQVTTTTVTPSTTTTVAPTTTTTTTVLKAN